MPDPTGKAKSFKGVAEIPLSLRITQTGSVKEGAGAFITSIDLSAGSQNAGTFPDGATIYWKISGIAQDDLALGTLSGQGGFINGNLEIQHSLIKDADTGEQFQVSIFSDSTMKQQIGDTASIGIQESEQNEALPLVTVAVSPSTAKENGESNLVYTFSRTGSTTNSLTVNYNIAGSADSADYTGATPGLGKTITIPSGSATAILTVDPTAESTIEVDETVAITLVTGTGYTIGTTAPVVGTITNDDFNSAPTALNLSATSFAEKIPAGSTVANLTTTDPDASNTFTYALVAGTGSADNAAFRIDGSQLIINTSPDFEAKTSYAIRVRSTDSGGLYLEKSLTLKVNDLDEGITHPAGPSPFLRGNSLYAIAYGPSWADAEANSVVLGGHLATVNDKDEDYFLWEKTSTSPSLYGDWQNLLWIGLTDQMVEGKWEWVSGDKSMYRNWNGEPDDEHGGQDYAWTNWYGFGWNDAGGPGGTWEHAAGIAEIPLTMAITRSRSSKEGAGVFTTSIHLTAGSTTNLANGSLVYWKVKGITAEDLDVGSAGLMGSGTISGGKLDIQHSLIQDADTGENFEVYVYSDAQRSQQIGAVSLVAIQESNPVSRVNYLLSSVPGVFREGVTLIAPIIAGDPDGDAANPSYSYQWFKNNSPIGGGTGSTYKVPNNGSGTYRVAITYTDAQGAVATVSSPAQLVDPYRGDTSAPLDLQPGRTCSLPGLRDYDGIPHGGAPEALKNSIAADYRFQGLFSLRRDGIKQAVFTNRSSGRWASAAFDPITRQIDYADNGKGGITRVIGIYIDILVAEGESNNGILRNGEVAPKRGGPNDSQRRFQNDLLIDNLSARLAGDFDGDGIQELYWKVNDGTAYLRSLLHDDGNIRYANYQSRDQTTSYLTSNGHADLIPSVL
jgi:hypothetical protein